MCGIVGSLGERNAVEVIMDGLHRLEYRGYDSSGICIKGDAGELLQFKQVGKLENLTQVLSNELPSSEQAFSIGIGHTRWATHGRVTDLNAHPHGNHRVSMVHNGIIENAQELRLQLQERGREFQSETDSEVFLHLVTQFLEMGQTLEGAVTEAFKQVQGGSAFVVIERESQKIVAIKRAAPIVCGKGEGGQHLLISSDPYALVGYVNTVFFPEDEVLCVLDLTSPQGICFQELDGSPSARVYKQRQNKSLQISEKGSFDHYMLKEIHEQPQLILNLIDYYQHGAGAEQLKAVTDLNPQLIHLSACGTAWHAGLCIKNLIEHNNQIPVNVDWASEFRYRNPLVSAGEMGLFISQSGETADTLAAQGLCRKRGMATISIVNVEGSALYRSCHHNLVIRAGSEIGVASTKAFTLMVLMGYIFSQRLAGKDIQGFLPEVERLAQEMEKVWTRADHIQRIAHDVYQKRGFFYTGRGKYFPIALEGALKLKEIAYVHAEGYAAGELKHGPIALVDEDMVNIALMGPELFDKTLSNMEEVRARGGAIVAIAPQGSHDLSKKAQHFFPLDFRGLENLSPLLVNMVMQLMAYYIARYKGTDIDQPRNLAKSVTVE